MRTGRKEGSLPVGNPGRLQGAGVGVGPVCLSMTGSQFMKETGDQTIWSGGSEPGKLSLH